MNVSSVTSAKLHLEAQIDPEVLSNRNQMEALSKAKTHLHDREQHLELQVYTCTYT